MKPQMTLIAGVGISGGQVDGGLGDPAVAARRWVDEGAKWVHVVDRDAALGRGDNAAAVKAAVHAVNGRAHVQLAGGIRDADSYEAALALHPHRIVLDTAALADMPWVTSVMAKHASHVAVDLAVHKLHLHAPDTAVHGQPMVDLLVDLEGAGCKNFVVTDVDAEGFHLGPKRKALKVVCDLERHNVVAGGGVAHLSDLHALLQLIPRGLEGVVLDHALYNGAFTFAEAVATAEPHYDLFIMGPANPVGASAIPRLG